jgi:rSAM/selenodomain-associated transferase 2
MTIAVVIPVLNEEQTLPRTLSHTLSLGFDEIIVVDGGSTDRTREIVASFAAANGVSAHLSAVSHQPVPNSALSTQHSALGAVSLLTSPPGRARQMNAGAATSRSDVLLFLHADTLLPDDAKRVIQTALADSSYIGGRFDVQFDRPSVWGFMISALMNVRSRLTGIATGDQAIFVRKDVFHRLGGYPEIPVMEDVAFTTRLKRVGQVAILRAKVTTSFRRWERCGPLRTILLMWMLRLLYRLGVSPHRLARLYPAAR